MRERFPIADQTKLVLLPGTNGNANGQRTIRATTLTNVHRVWVDAIADIRLDDGTPFPRRLVVPYAYRHIVPA